MYTATQMRIRASLLRPDPPRISSHQSLPSAVCSATCGSCTCGRACRTRPSAIGGARRRAARRRSRGRRRERRRGDRGAHERHGVPQARTRGAHLREGGRQGRHWAVHLHHRGARCCTSCGARRAHSRAAGELPMEICCDCARMRATHNTAGAWVRTCAAEWAAWRARRR